VASSSLLYIAVQIRNSAAILKAIAQAATTGGWNVNYTKAQIAAQQQLMDASNTSRDMRNVQIRDEQTASPTHCAAIDGGVSTQSASVQAYAVGQTIAAVHDQRGEAGVGMPSHFGQAQGVASMAAAQRQ